MRRVFNPKSCLSGVLWSDFPADDILRKLIQNQLDLVLPSIYGYCMVSIGDLADDFTFKEASVVNVVRLNAAYSNAAWVDQSQLPLSSDDVDAIFLPFQLEQTQDPHALMRESYRALRPGGKLIITMVNPYSLWGLRKVVSRFEKNPFWKLPFYSSRRVMDWLRVLDFKVTSSHNLFNPWRIKSKYRNDTIATSAAYSMLGTVTFLVAEKRVVPLTLKPSWQKLKTTGQVTIEGLRKSINNL